MIAITPIAIPGIQPMSILVLIEVVPLGVSAAVEDHRKLRLQDRLIDALAVAKNRLDLAARLAYSGREFVQFLFMDGRVSRSRYEIQR